MALESHLYGDPMEIAAANQARERRQSREPQRVKNTPLPELPRRWESEWSPARQKAEAFLSGELDEYRAPSPAWQALEALFK